MVVKPTSRQQPRTAAPGRPRPPRPEAVEVDGCDIRGEGAPPTGGVGWAWALWEARPRADVKASNGLAGVHSSRRAGRQRLSVSALVTTLTLENAIAAPAITGLRKPAAASGIPTTL